MVQTPTALQPQHHPKYKCSRSLQIELSSPRISRVHLPCGLQARKRRLPCSVFNSPSTRNRHASACTCRRPPLKNALHNGKCSNVPCAMGSFVPQIHSLLVSSSGSGPSVGASSAALFGRGAVGLTSHRAPENVDSKSPCGDGSTKPNPSAKTREWCTELAPLPWSVPVCGQEARDAHLGSVAGHPSHQTTLPIVDTARYAAPLATESPDKEDLINGTYTRSSWTRRTSTHMRGSSSRPDRDLNTPRQHLGSPLSNSQQLLWV